MSRLSSTVPHQAGIFKKRDKTVIFRDKTNPMDHYLSMREKRGSGRRNVKEEIRKKGKRKEGKVEKR